MSAEQRASVTPIGDAIGSNVEVNRDSTRLRLNDGIYLPRGRSKGVVGWQDGDQVEVAGVRLAVGESGREFEFHMCALREKGLFKIGGFLAIFEGKLGNRN
jgi:hypothetical protein